MSRRVRSIIDMSTNEGRIPLPGDLGEPSRPKLTKSLLTDLQKAGIKRFKESRESQSPRQIKKARKFGQGAGIPKPKRERPSDGSPSSHS